MHTQGFTTPPLRRAGTLAPVLGQPCGTQTHGSSLQPPASMSRPPSIPVYTQQTPSQVSGCGSLTARPSRGHQEGPGRWRVWGLHLVGQVPQGSGHCILRRLITPAQQGHKLNSWGRRS